MNQQLKMANIIFILAFTELPGVLRNGADGTGGLTEILIAVPIVIGRITHENNQFRGYQCLAVFVHASRDEWDDGETGINR